MRGQAALEYLIMVGLLLIALTFIFSLASIRTREIEDSFKIDTAENTVAKIVESADIVYSLGAPSKTTFLAQIPSVEPEGTYVSSKVVNLRVLTSSGSKDVWEISKSALQGYVPTSAGNHWISVQMTDCGYVFIAPKGVEPPC